MEPLEEITPAAVVPVAPALITLTIPAVPEYVSTVRLAVMGIAGRMGFTYDEVEDIRLAVGEACTNAIARITDTKEYTITVRAQVDPTALTLEVEDDILATSRSENDEEMGDEDGEGQELGALLMEILVDEVTFELLQTGSRVRLLKRIGSMEWNIPL